MYFMAYTLLLDTDNWDLCLDSAGRISTTDGTYATAQNVANAVRLFTDDSIYEPERGIPHFVTSLGAHVSSAVIRARVNAMAEEVDGVESAVTDLTSLTDRTFSGTIEITTEDGETVDVDI